MVSSVSLDKTQPELNSKELKKVCWMAPKEVAKNGVSNAALLNLQSPISPVMNSNVNCFSPTESISMNLALLDVFTHHQLTPPHTQPYFSPNSDQCRTSPNMTAIASPNIFADEFKNGPTTPQFCSPPYFPQVSTLPLLPSASQSLKQYFDSMASPLMDPYKLQPEDKSEKPPTSMNALPVPRQLLDQRRDSSSSHSSDQVSTSTAPSEKPRTVPSALRIQTNYQSPNVPPAFTGPLPQSLSSPTTPAAPTSAPSVIYPGLPFMSEISQNMMPLSQLPVRNYGPSDANANKKQQPAPSFNNTKNTEDVQIKRPIVPYVPQSKPRKMHPAVFKCAFQGCPKVFTRPYNLRSHMKIHTGEKLFCCEFCDAKFTRGHDLKRHTRLHTDERPFECTRCLRSFSRSDALRRHQKVDNCPPLGEDESYTPEEREALLQKEYQRQQLVVQKKMAKRRAKQKESAEVVGSNVEDVFLPDNRAEFRTDFVVGNEMLGNF